MQPSERESYQELFNIIRPQTGVYGPALWVLLGFTLVVVLLVGGTALIRHRHRLRSLRKAFHDLATERGLSPAEENRLSEMAAGTTSDQPLVMYSSIAAFEEAVESLVPTADPTPANTALLGELESLRSKLGFDQFPSRWSLRHTRQIPPGARLLVGVRRGGEDLFTTCTVDDSNASHIMATPLLKKDQEVLKEVQGDESLFVRYWRTGDTEYRFTSTLRSKTPPERDQLFLAHASKLERLQNRDFFRLRVNLPVTLYDLPDPDLAEISQDEFVLPQEARPVLTGDLVDVSVGGCAVRSEQELLVDSLVVIDPEIGGPFSLGRMICRVGQAREETDARLLTLEYVNATPNVQDRLMRELYAQQQERAGGRIGPTYKIIIDLCGFSSPIMRVSFRSPWPDDLSDPVSSTPSR